MYSTKEAEAMTGLTAATLRYYEREGLLPPVGRTERKYRRYSDDDIEWIRQIRCLRRAGAPIRTIRDYMGLLARGGETIPERRLLAREYADRLRAQISDLKEALQLTEEKVAFYDELMGEPRARSLTAAEEWSRFRERGGGR